MLGRCSEQTKLKRFHGLLAEFPEPYLTEALSGSLGHLALVIDAGGMISALASCRMVGEHAAELAILIEDARQRQGWGSRLLALLVAYADSASWSTLRMTLLAEQAWILPTLQAYGQCRSRNSFGVIEAELSRHLPASGGHATLGSGPLASIGDLSLHGRRPAVDRRSS